MRRRRAVDTMPADAVRARNSHDQNSRATRRPPPKKKGPPETTARHKEEVWKEQEAGVPSASEGDKGEPRRATHNTQTTPIYVAKLVSQ